MMTTAPAAPSGTSTPTTRARLRPFRTPLRGHAFAAPPAADAVLRIGCRARLSREPANPADPLAVAVWLDAGVGPWRIGYLDRGVAARVAPRLDRGLAMDAEVEGWVPEPKGRWQRPLVMVRPRPVTGRSGGHAPEGPDEQLRGRLPGVSRRMVRPSPSR